MARIKKICSFSIWDEYAHDSWISPIIAFRVLYEPYILQYGSEGIKHEHGLQIPPGRAQQGESEEAHQH